MDRTYHDYLEALYAGRALVFAEAGGLFKAAPYREHPQPFDWFSTFPSYHFGDLFDYGGLTRFDDPADVPWADAEALMHEQGRDVAAFVLSFDYDRATAIVSMDDLIAKLLVIGGVRLFHETVARLLGDVAALERAAPPARWDHHGEADRLQQFAAGVLLLQPAMNGLGRADILGALALALDDEQAGQVAEKLDGFHAGADTHGHRELLVHAVFDHDVLDFAAHLGASDAVRLNADHALEHIGAGAAKALHLSMFKDGVGDGDGRGRQLLAFGCGREDHAAGQVGGFLCADARQDQRGFRGSGAAAVVHDIAERPDRFGGRLNCKA